MTSGAAWDCFLRGGDFERSAGSFGGGRRRRGVEDDAEIGGENKHGCFTHGEHEVEKLDWTNVEEWPEHEFDVALASDVLYDEKCAQCVANVIDRVLKKKKKITNGDDDVGDGGSITALLCDPANRENREKFSEMCDKLGLEAIDADFPGNPKMRLVQVLRK